MSVKFLKNARIVLTIADIIYLTVKAYVVPLSNGHKNTLAEAIMYGVIVAVLLFVAFSDWMYYDFMERGGKLKYKNFQLLGIAVALLFLAVFYLAE